jgi:hypothetical protein
MAVTAAAEANTLNAPSQLHWMPISTYIECHLNLYWMPHLNLHWTPHYNLHWMHNECPISTYTYRIHWMPHLNLHWMPHLNLHWMPHFNLYWMTHLNLYWMPQLNLYRMHHLNIGCTSSPKMLDYYCVFLHLYSHCSTSNGSTAFFLCIYDTVKSSLKMSSLSATSFLREESLFSRYTSTYIAQLGVHHLISPFWPCEVYRIFLRSTENLIETVRKSATYPTFSSS